ncbi:hypothetical protein GN958_ATG17285 [Phytophthora infestans]|uniref:Uncharacterized protein n=1 Tax=Phytophthora infestans TaxID=4787 RepID=A0A8S9TZP4_PHYIN|nr:hypothetical protein GN958_ATG17285 [Phytophthora infestans]
MVFLDQNDALKVDEKANSTVDDVLEASYQLVAVAEELLASHSDNTREHTVSSDTKSFEEDKSETPIDKLSDEKQRETQNALAAQRRLRHRQKIK